MFGGIVQAVGKLVALKEGNSSIEIESSLLQQCELGHSVSVNGVCLTVTKKQGCCCCWFDLVPETLQRTNLKTLAQDAQVNLELSLKYGDFVGGHMVQGHVDGVATIISIKKQENALLVSFGVAQGIEKYLVEKDYVTIDGMSITLVSVAKESFVVTLIPHTVQETIAKSYKENSQVNIEINIMAKYAEKKQ
jgi:riboflavin synthase